MNYDFSASEQDFFEKIARTVTPFVESRETEDAGLEDAERNLRDALELLAKIGYIAPGLIDGSEPGNQVALMGAMEILARHSPSIFLAVEMSTRLFGRLVARFGASKQEANSSIQKAKASKHGSKGSMKVASASIPRELLKDLVAGKLVGAVALSEDAVNVDNDPISTFGKRDKAGVRIRGIKNYVVNGPFADWYAVIGTLEGALSVFLIPKGTAGLEVGPRLSTLGHQGLAVSGLELEDCWIPDHQVLGPFKGNARLSTLRLWENQILIAASLGMMQATLETARTYANLHVTGGKPLIAYQEIAFKLAEMLTMLQTSQYLAYRAAWSADAAPKEAESLTWCAKVFCGDAAEKVASEGLRILSGAGYTTRNPAETAYRNAKYAQLAGTSTEIARMKLGDLALGKPFI